MRNSMDKRREELEELKADLHLALLMDEYAERMGKQVREEAEAAFERGELEMPPELDARCRALISEAPAAEAKKKPMRAAMRYALVAALSIILLLGTLIAVQAAGIDVFGSIATWTDSVFHFQTKDDTVIERQSVESENQIQIALREMGMPVELAPTWFPEGYEIQNVDVSGVDDPILVVQCDIQKDNYPLINVIIKKSNQFDFNNTELEKQTDPPMLYTSNSRVFYIFKNADRWVGCWSDSDYRITISGVSTEDQLVSIIDSIGGNLND